VAGPRLRARPLSTCFSYHGAFALQLADRCESGGRLDVSEDAVRAHQTERRAQRIGNVEARLANVFDALRQMERDRETVRHDRARPAAFAKSRDAVEKATPATRRSTSGDEAAQAASARHLHVLYHVDEAAFGQIVYEASIDARAR